MNLSEKGIGTIMFGIMQGRLTEPKGRGIQFFPFDNWENEFRIAKKLKLDEIEFIFDYDNYNKNPLFLNNGVEIKRIIDETGVVVNSVCFDYFMRRPFYKYKNNLKIQVMKENKIILKQLLTTMQHIGSSLLEIPLVDASSLKTESEAIEFKNFIEEVLAEEQNEIKIGLETDLAPINFKCYLETFDSPKIGANYDSGNSSGLGYQPYEEITILKDYIFNIHIKDRVLHGTTVELGTGNADFEHLFKALKEINYKNSFILQAARGIEGKEEETIRSQLNFVKGYLKKWALE